ncbi:unnamed protein product [Rangifer tarandus platyrhynchus]|uniref:Uncharacterized protein n=1 Tax=Rangifer tarandus platyrhynchus TaxID=3082113 RepID=A0AC59ZY20_RANTA
MATHASILAWEIPRTQEPGGAAIHGVTKSQTQLKHLSTHAPEFDNKIRKPKPQQLLHTSLSPAAVSNCCNFLEGPGPTGRSLSKFFISQFAQDSLPQVEVQPWATGLLKLPRDSRPENTGAGRLCTLGRQPTDTPGPVTASAGDAARPGVLRPSRPPTWASCTDNVLALTSSSCRAGQHGMGMGKQLILL